VGLRGLQARKCVRPCVLQVRCRLLGRVARVVTIRPRYGGLHLDLETARCVRSRSGWLGSGVRAVRRSLFVFLLVVLLATAAAPPALAASASRSDYRARPITLVDVCPEGLPWTGYAPVRLPGPKPRDSEGVPMYRVGGQLYYRPGALAINGMKRVDAYLDTGSRRQLEQALKQATRLRKMALKRRHAWWLPFWYPYPPASQKPPWFNAMTQGLVLSFFVRLYHVTGHPTHLRAADGVFRSFLRMGQDRDPWVAYVDGGRNLWLEHYPLKRPDHILNAHLHAIFGIYEYWQATRNPKARRLLEGAITTVRRNIYRYRYKGGISLYGLRSRAQNLKYHEIHVWQLTLLGLLTSDRDIARAAARFRADRRPWGQVNGRPQRLDRTVAGRHCHPKLTYARGG
jgi:hypothetical protein